MAETYAVKITTQAENQMHEITRYIASELKAPDAALNLLDALEDAISSHSEYPQRVPLTEEEPWHSYGIRKMPVKNFLVYFWIDDDHLMVQITAVIYGRRDQIRQLSQRDIDIL